MPGFQSQYVNIHNSKNGPIIFSRIDIPAATNLGPGFMKLRSTGNPDLDYIQTKFGKMVQHSDDSNLYIKPSRWKYYFFTSRAIKRGESLTINYNDLPWKFRPHTESKYDEFVSKYVNEQYDKMLSISKISDINNPIHTWLKELNLKSMAVNDFPRNKESSYIFLEKIDGELNAMTYLRDEDCFFVTRHNTLRRNLLVLDEYKNAFDALKDINEITIMGEGIAIKNNILLPFNQTESILKTSYRIPENNSMYHHMPYDIFSINGKRQNNLSKNLEFLKRFTNNKTRIKPIRYIKGNLDIAWKEFVDTPGIEGLVARNGKNYKLKKTFNLDLVIVAIGNKNMKTWERNEVSYIKVALMDKNDFILATNVGTGFDRNTRQYLYKWAYQNMIDDKNDEIWVKPKLVVEVEYRRIQKTKKPIFRFKENIGYKYMGDRESFSLIQPSFIRFRKDKKPTEFDVGIRQIP